MISESHEKLSLDANFSHSINANICHNNNETPTLKFHFWNLRVYPTEEGGYSCFTAERFVMA